jgi:hypothetical protein
MWRSGQASDMACWCLPGRCKGARTPLHSVAPQGSPPSLANCTSQTALTSGAQRLGCCTPAAARRWGPPNTKGQAHVAKRVSHPQQCCSYSVVPAWYPARLPRAVPCPLGVPSIPCKPCLCRAVPGWSGCCTSAAPPSSASARGGTTSASRPTCKTCAAAWRQPWACRRPRRRRQGGRRGRAGRAPAAARATGVARHEQAGACLRRGRWAQHWRGPSSSAAGGSRDEGQGGCAGSLKASRRNESRALACAGVVWWASTSCCCGCLPWTASGLQAFRVDQS